MRSHSVLSIADLERGARRYLPSSVYGYVSGASEDHSSLEANRYAYAHWRFLPRPLRGMSNRSQSIHLFGADYAAPLGISPMGAVALCRFDGDCILARVAHDANVPFVLSAASTVPLERIVTINPDTWYQAYLPARHDVIDPLLARVDAAAIRVLVITVDVPIASIRENELRNGFSLPLRPSLRLVTSGLARPRWLLGTFGKTLLRQGIPHFENFTAERGGPIIQSVKDDHRAGRAAMTWEHIRHIRDRWPGVLVLKGILRPEDARMAHSIGVDGIFVSNHGGRQLDGAIASLDALPDIARATEATGMTLIIDGGIRRGTDVLKALALGANAAFCGRPVLYGLAAGGQVLAAKALAVLKQEIDVNQALLGCDDVCKLNPEYLTAG
ncbi:MAG: alpha-hydroxy-acid oxidizing protein [Candidimonas sp.]|nr:MAG: alpha-hydroxy-acid oxidizing protein [Candidimonas sp.]